MSHRTVPLKLAPAGLVVDRHEIGVAGIDEFAVTVHRVETGALSAYMNMPGMALAAARTVKGEPRADGFRVADAAGRVMLDYVDRVGRL